MPDQTNSTAFCEITKKGLQEAMWWAEDNGLEPWQILSHWFHTHPHMSATPSGTDEATFAESFNQQWLSSMCILSKTGDTSARVHISNPRARITIIVPLILPSTLPESDPTCAPWFNDLKSRTTNRTITSGYTTVDWENAPDGTGHQGHTGFDRSRVIDTPPSRRSLPPGQETGEAQGLPITDEEALQLVTDQQLDQWEREGEGPRGGVLQTPGKTAPAQGTAKALNLLSKSRPVQPANITLKDQKLENLACAIRAFEKKHPGSVDQSHKFRALCWTDKQLVNDRIKNLDDIETYHRYGPHSYKPTVH